MSGNYRRNYSNNMSSSLKKSDDHQTSVSDKKTDRESSTEKIRHRRSPDRRSRSNNNWRNNNYYDRRSPYRSRSNRSRDKHSPRPHQEYHRENDRLKIREVAYHNLPRSTATLPTVSSKDTTISETNQVKPPDNNIDVNTRQPIRFQITAQKKATITETRPFDNSGQSDEDEVAIDTCTNTEEPRREETTVRFSQENTKISRWDRRTPSTVVTSTTQNMAKLNYRDVHCNDPEIIKNLINVIRGCTDGVDITEDFENKFTDAFKIKIIYNPNCNSMLALLMANQADLLIDISREPPHAIYRKKVSNYIPPPITKSIINKLTPAKEEVNKRLISGEVKLGTIIPSVSDSWQRNSIINVKIREIIDPNQIYVTMSDCQGFMSLHHSMQDIYGKLGPSSVPHILDKDLYVACKWNGTVYRAKILETLPGEIYCCLVYLIDLGKTRTVINSDIFYLYEQFANIPTQVVLVSLFAKSITPNRQWPPEIIDKLKESLKKKSEYRMLFSGIKLNEVYYVDIVTSQLGSLTKFVKSNPNVDLINTGRFNNFLYLIEQTEAKYAPIVASRNQYKLPAAPEVGIPPLAPSGDDNEVVMLYRCVTTFKKHYSTRITVGAKPDLILINYQNQPYLLLSEVVNKYYSKICPNMIFDDYISILKNLNGTGLICLCQNNEPMLFKELRIKYDDPLFSGKKLWLIPPQNVLFAFRSIGMELPQNLHEDFQCVVAKFDRSSILWNINDQDPVPTYLTKQEMP